MTGPQPLQPSELFVALKGRVINHFTNWEGILGILGGVLPHLQPGQSLSVDQAHFGTGAAEFYANAPGDIFVTDVPQDAPAHQLALIGVFGDRQEYVLSMSEWHLVAQGIRIVWTAPTRRIGTIPARTIITGPLVVTRRKVNAAS